VANLRTFFNDIRNKLRADLTSVVDSNIIFATDEIGEAGILGFPCVFIIDGGDENAEHAGGNILTQRVDIMIFADIPGRREEKESIVGDGTEKGVVQLADDVRSSLSNWRALSSGNTSIKTLYISSEPSVIGEEAGGGWRATKTLTFDFEIQ